MGLKGAIRVIQPTGTPASRHFSRRFFALIDMNINIRPVTPKDLEACGRIIYEAFKGIADQHNFRRDFPSVDAATDFAGLFVNDPSIYGVVAEVDGQVVGSNFLTEWDPIRAVGPITVDPERQAKGVGRQLMKAVIERGKDAAGIRLVQDSFNTKSLSLYASLGFEVKEPLAIIEGDVDGELPAGFEVRPLTENDLHTCAELCVKVHGFERTNELRALPPMLTPYVGLRHGRITAYASATSMWPLNHAVAETEEDLRLLLVGAGRLSAQPLSFLLATRQASLFRWCLSNGMRVAKPMTLMSMGAYQEPRGGYLPSVGY
jgi:ribosomal protein S18 acetylase RimI-like enzyme